MSNRYKAAIARVIVLVCVFLSGCFLAPSINITGTWTGEMTWTSGPATGLVQAFTLVLEHVDREVTGVARLPSPGGQSFEIPIVQGGARSVNLSVVAQGENPLVPGQPAIELWLDGQYDQASMAGDGTQSIDGTTYAFEWVATLVTQPVTASL